MTWTPIFPLEVVLFPGGELALHIFEPRYREMISRCIRDSESFGVVSQSDEDLAEVGCRAIVARVLRHYADGRFDILARGLETIRISNVREHTAGYLEAETEALLEISEEADHELEDRVEEQFRKFKAIAGDHNSDPPPRGPRWSFRLAEAIRLSIAQRQQMLNQQSENERLRGLEKQLRILASVEAEREKIQGALRGNGRLRGSEGVNEDGSMGETP